MVNEQMTLRALRYRSGYSQDEAAEIIGVAKSSLKNWESDNSVMRVDHLRSLSSLYQYPIGKIYIGKESEFQEKIRHGFQNKDF